MFPIEPCYNVSFWIVIPSFLKKKFSTNRVTSTNHLSFYKNFLNLTKNYNIFSSKKKKNKKLSKLKKNSKYLLKVFKKKFKYKKTYTNSLKKYYRKKFNLNLKTILLQDVDISDIKTSKSFYQYAYKFFLSTYYFNNEDSLFFYVLDSNIFKEKNSKKRFRLFRLLKKNLKIRFLLFRLLNNLIFLYEELQIKNLLRKYYILFFTHSQLILMNYSSNNVFDFKFFYKQHYKNY
jgi:hypothetical protein